MNVKRLATAVLAALAACTHAPMITALSSKPLSIDRLRPVHIDEEASSLTVEAPERSVRDPGKLRARMAEALNTELEESTLGRSMRNGRFRAKVVAAESNNAWSVLGWFPPLIYPALAPLYLPNIDMDVRIELGLQIGDEYYEAVGKGSVGCESFAHGPCFEEALGYALNDALNQLKDPQRVAAVEGGR